MGRIDLDPASSPKANETVNASEIYTVEDDGLALEWRGCVWLNPPYAQPAIAHFAEKVASEWEADHIESAIVLTHNYTDTAWFHRLAGASSAICFSRGRVRFVSPDGELAAPTQGQAFFYFGRNQRLFASRFTNIGFVTQAERV